MGKKLLTLLLTFALVLGMVPSAWGEEGEALEPAITQDQAVEIVKKAVGEELFKSQYDFDAELGKLYYNFGPLVWSMSWRDESSLGNSSFYFWARVDATTGELLMFSCSGTEVPKDSKLLTPQEAQKKALAFIERLHPDKVEEVVLKETPAYYGSRGYIDLNYRFYWERQIQGIPVEQNGFYVGVDAFSGTITDYSYYWTPDINPAAAEVLPEEEVKKLVLDNLGVVLSYEALSPEKVQEIKPVYKLNSSVFAYVDAQEGRPLDQTGKFLNWEELRQFEQEFTYKPSPKTSGKTPVPTTRLSPQEGLAKAQEFFQALGQEGKVVRAGSGGSLGPDGYREFWNYIVEPEEGVSHHGYDFNLSIDVATGEVVHYVNWNLLRGAGLKEGIKELTREEAQKLAEAFLNKVHGGILDQIVLAKEWEGIFSSEPEDVYYFSWIPLVNGLPFEGAQIIVALHKATGEVARYEYNWRDRSFVTPADLIGAQEAKEILAQNMEPVLAYVQPDFYGSEPGEPILVYKFEYPQGAFIDGATGQPVGNRASITLDPQRDLSPAMFLLQNSGLMPQDATKDTPVTRREALIAIIAMTSYYSASNYQKINPQFQDLSPQDPDYALFQEGVGRGIIAPGGKFHPEEWVSRQTAALWAVKALNYGKFAQLPLTIQPPVKDWYRISQDARNYVAVALALGLLEAPEEQFQPQKPLSWQELAELVVKGAFISRSEH